MTKAYFYNSKSSEKEIKESWIKCPESVEISIPMTEEFIEFFKNYEQQMFIDYINSTMRWRWFK